jgi:hypothetical protein
LGASGIGRGVGGEVFFAEVGADRFVDTSKEDSLQPTEGEDGVEERFVDRVNPDLRAHEFGLWLVVWVDELRKAPEVRFRR